MTPDDLRALAEALDALPVWHGITVSRFGVNSAGQFTLQLFAACRDGARMQPGWTQEDDPFSPVGVGPTPLAAFEAAMKGWGFDRPTEDAALRRLEQTITTWLHEITA